MTSLPYNIRWEQSAWAVDAAKDAFSAWVNGRQAADRSGFHASQLADIGAVLESAAKTLRASLDRALATTEDVALARVCRSHDAALGQVYGLWERVRGPFDQRDRAGAAASTSLLEAADEVAWSCYRPVLTNAAARSGRVKQWPPPLACFDATYLPLVSQRRRDNLVAAIEGGQTPGALAAVLGELPVTLIRLPPWTVYAPWSLVFVAHEVGHLVYQQLGAGVGRVLQERLAAVGAGWGSWNEECFADLFSVLTMGEWALWALVDVERGTPAAMTAREDAGPYPSAVVRLALMATSLRRLGIDPGQALRGLDLEAIAASDAVARAQLELVPEAVEALMGDLGGGLGTLRGLCEFDDNGGPASRGAVADSARLANALRQGRVPTGSQRGSQTTRLLMRAGVRAWAELAPTLAALDGPARAAARGTLGDALVATLLAYAPQGTRRTQESGKMEDLGRALVEGLLGLKGF